MKKLLLILFLCLTFPLSAQNLTLKLNNVTVKQAIELIREKIGYNFVFEATDLNTRKVISVNEQNKPLQEILSKVFADQNVDFEIKGRNIIIRKSTLPSSSVSVRKITGVVTNEDGEPVVGASVLLKNNLGGTITDTNGVFEITFTSAANAVMTISSIGYVTKQINVGNTDHFTVRLEEYNRVLDEVVVIGYGTQKKVNLTGAVNTINVSSIIESRPIFNIANGLAGVAPGVYVGAAGKPAAGTPALLVRGQGTLNNSAPLAIIDGVEGDLNSVNAEDIENMSILKDAA